MLTLEAAKAALRIAVSDIENDAYLSRLIAVADAYMRLRGSAAKCKCRPRLCIGWSRISTTSDSRMTAAHRIRRLPIGIAALRYS